LHTIKGKTRETWRRKANESNGRNPQDGQAADNSKTGETRRHNPAKRGKASGSKVMKITTIARLPKSKPGENRRRKVMGLKSAQV